MANSHPGSYCGQDAYSDMLVVDDGFMHGKRTTASSSADRGCRCAELYARSNCYHAETCGGKQTVGSLCAHDGRGFNGQDVANDKLIIEVADENV